MRGAGLDREELDERQLRECAASRPIEAFRYETASALAPGIGQTSRLVTYSAFFSMNSRRGSTASPISVVKMSSAATASSMRTCSRRRDFGIDRRLPELRRVHLAEALVALDRLSLARLIEEPADRLGERLRCPGARRRGAT